MTGEKLLSLNINLLSFFKKDFFPQLSFQSFHNTSQSLIYQNTAAGGKDKYVFLASFENIRTLKATLKDIMFGYK